MIYAVATDHQRITVASDGSLTGIATLGREDTWDLRMGIGVAIIRLYVDWAPVPRHDMKCYNHYYLVNVNMAVMAELIARSCIVDGIRGRSKKWKTVRAFGSCVPLEIMSYEKSYKDMLIALKDLTGFEPTEYPKAPEYDDDPFSS